MADQKTRRELNALLALHLVIFAVVWVLNIISGSLASSNLTLILLLWMLVLLAHVAAHAYFAGKTAGGGDTQAAYRQGFRDAVRDLSDADPERYGDRLALDDEDGYESGEKPKRQASR